MAYKALKLPRLPIGWKDQPQLFERYWDEAMSKLEKTLDSILIIPEIQAAIAAAQATADMALETASTAAEGVAAEASLVNSYPQLATGDIISASSAGVVTIAAHTRVYGNPSLNPSVAVSGGTLTTGASSDSIIRVFYSDPTRAGGSVVYQFTVDPADYPAQGNNNHSVGAVAIPSTGTSPGTVPGRPGSVNPTPEQ